MGDDVCLICGRHVGYCMGNCSEPSDGSGEVSEYEIEKRDLEGLIRSQMTGDDYDDGAEQQQAAWEELGREYRRKWD